MNREEYDYARSLIRENGAYGLCWLKSSGWLSPADASRIERLIGASDDYLAMRAAFQAQGMGASMAMQLSAPNALFEAWRKRSKYIR
jgi:hypothetical protein